MTTLNQAIRPQHQIGTPRRARPALALALALAQNPIVTNDAVFTFATGAPATTPVRCARGSLAWSEATARPESTDQPHGRGHLARATAASRRVP